MKPRATILACALCLVGYSCSYDEPEVASGPSVVLISVDTLRADRLGCYGYTRDTSPALDSLAARSFVFDRAYTHSPNTIVAHASLLTALNPWSHGVRADVPLAESFTTLSEYFRDAGYETAGFTAHGDWLTEAKGFAQGFDHFLSKYWSAAEHNGAIGDWLRSRPRPEVPFFLFVHYYDVHSDWQELPYETGTDFDHKFTGDYAGDFRGCRADFCASGFLLELNRDRGFVTAEELRWIEALYDGGIAYTDHQIGLLLEQLSELGAFDESWIVVTSDHGEEFLEHGRVLHSQPYEETARIPLIVKPPRGKTTTVVSDVVGLVDLMPTLLESAAIEARGPLQGRSLLPLLNGETLPEVPVYFYEYDEPDNMAVRSGNLTFLARDDFTRLELYDDGRDPQQTTDVVENRPETADRLLDMVRRFHREQLIVWKALRTREIGLSEEEIERLRSLGYVN